MSSLIGRIATFRRSPHAKRILKFGTVSVISTVIAQSVLFATYDAGHIASAMVCNVIATTVSTFPAYYLNRRWTWGKRGKSHLWREVAPFWILAFIGLVFSTLAVGLAAHNADRVSNAREVKDLFVHGANFLAYGLIWVARYSIFNKYLFGPGTPTAGGSDDTESVAPTPSPASGAPATATPVPAAAAPAIGTPAANAAPATAAPAPTPASAVATPAPTAATAAPAASAPAPPPRRMDERVS